MTRVTFFGSTRVLASINVAAVGFALAACTSAGLTQLMQMPGLVSGPTTLVAGVQWARLMRSKRTVGRSRIRAGWLWSIPIAMLNAGLSCTIYLSHGELAVRGLLLGPTLGVLVWGPALLLTLVCFGVPIAWSQQLAEKGLAGEERGEAAVGLLCAALAVLGYALAVDVPGAPTWWDTERYLQRDVGLWFAKVCGALGAASGTAAAMLAFRREGQRRAFVDRVEAGQIAGFRVDESDEGRVLVRVTELGSGYRVSNFTEELVALDEAGEATHARSKA